MRSQNLLPSCPSSLSEQLRRKADHILATISRTNYSTQFAQTASELVEFRDITTGLIHTMDDEILSESFRTAVCFTNYSSYAPLVEKFFEKPCKESAVTDLLAPGLPDFLIQSSSTSGGRAKVFPRYNCYSKVPFSETGWWSSPGPLQKYSKAYLWSFHCTPVPLEDENDRTIKTIYIAPGSTVQVRGKIHMYPENDSEKMGTFILDHAAPYAAAFIKNWRSTLVIQGLFALCNRSLKTMTMALIATIVDMIRHLDTEFELVLDCIANGTIPDLDGIADVRQYLEMNMVPDPIRAEELRALGRPSSRLGWCALAWPNLRSITTVAGGSFATSIPPARWLLGSNVEIHDAVYACSEGATIGFPYNVRELNRYKPNEKNIMEFLDITKDEATSSLSQIWEVGLGKRYEVVLTTPDGIWRYRLGDVIEICGFDPADGAPIIQFIERRNMALRFPKFMVTEEELRAAVSFMAETLSVRIFGWTTAIDSRSTLHTIGFFVEIAGDIQGVDLTRAAEYVLDKLLQSNSIIATAMECEVLRKPTVRIVRRGTFNDFLELRVREGMCNVAQFKMPVVLPKPEYVAWFSERVERDV